MGCDSMKKSIVLCGYGNVGYELIRLIEEKKDYINRKYGVELCVSCVCAKTSAVAGKIDVQELLRYGKHSKGIADFSGADGVKAMSGPVLAGDIFVDATSNNKSAELVMKAINAGMDVVLVSKSSLITNFTQIMGLASIKKVKVKYSGAAAAALPVLDTGLYSLAGCTVNSIEGVLSGTANYLLTKMQQDNLTLNDALSIAVKKGYAEQDSSLDVSGMDSAIKLLILIKSFMDENYNLEDIEIEGIDKIDTSILQNAVETGSQIKLIASARLENGEIKASVKPVMIHQGNILYNVKYTDKAAILSTDTMGKVGVFGGATSPRAAAAAALKDIINIAIS